MVAAGFGLPVAQANEASAHPETLSRSHTITRITPLNNLALLQGSLRRPGSQVDFWQQHAIRTVIRHLSFTTLTPLHEDRLISALPAEAHALVLLDTLSVLLTHESRSRVSAPILPASVTHPPAAWQAGIWLSQVQGTRAGPAALSAIPL